MKHKFPAVVTTVGPDWTLVYQWELIGSSLYASVGVDNLGGSALADIMIATLFPGSSGFKERPMFSGTDFSGDPVSGSPRSQNLRFVSTQWPAIPAGGFGWASYLHLQHLVNRVYARTASGQTQVEVSVLS